MNETAYREHVSRMVEAEKLMADVNDLYPGNDPVRSAKRAYCDGAITRDEWRLIRERYGV